MLSDCYSWSAFDAVDYKSLCLDYKSLCLCNRVNNEHLDTLALLAPAP